MAAKNSAITKTQGSVKVFGKREPDAIFQPPTPLNLRADCKLGTWKLGQDNRLGQTMEFAVISFRRWFGKLGLTGNKVWGQVFLICTDGQLPANTVCVTYLKTQSLSGFMQKVSEIMGQGIDPGEGIFKASFVKHSSKDSAGNPTEYYSAVFDWRPRTNAEQAQLALIGSFLESGPNLNDPDGTREMTCMDEINEDQAQAILNAQFGERPAVDGVVTTE